VPRKNVLNKYQIITAGDMSGNITSLVTIVAFMDNLAIQVIATGAPNGTFTVEASTDFTAIEPGENVTSTGTWDPVGTATIAAAGSITFDVHQLAPCAVRLRYAFISGTGTCNAYIAGKEI